MILLFILAVLQSDPPEIIKMQEDLVALEPVHPEEISKPLLNCVKQEADLYRLDANDKGNMLKATQFAKDLLVKCGLQNTRAELVAAVRKREPQITESKAGERADAYLSLNGFIVNMLAAKVFQTEGALPPSPVVTIPSPEENNAQNK